MKALGPSRSYSALPVITSPKSISPESRQFPSSQLSRKFSGMYSPVRITGGAVQRNQRLGVGKQIIQPIEKFWRQSEALVPCAASRDLLRHELRPVRLDAGEVADRDALHLRDGLTDLRQHALLLVLRQTGPRLDCPPRRTGA